jgi:hypothetical protein
MKKILHLLLALVFLLFAYWNMNDPDALVWVAAYGLVSLLFGLAVAGLGDRRITTALGALLFGWMLTMLPGMFAWVRDGFPSITEEMKATAPHIEVVREFLGLLIAVVCLGVLFLSQRSGRAAQGTSN